MGIIHSLFCSLTFCLERVLTWTCCAFLFMLLMLTLVLLMIYSITVGYHYAQKELADFALSSRSSTEGPSLRAEPDERPVVRLVAVNRTEVERAPQSILETYQTTKHEPEELLYLESTQTPVVILETEIPPRKQEFGSQKHGLVRRLINRFRRSRSNTTSTLIPFFRPLKNYSDPVQVLKYSE